MVTTHSSFCQECGYQLTAAKKARPITARRDVRAKTIHEARLHWWLLPLAIIVFVVVKAGLLALPYLLLASLLHGR